MNHSHQVDEPWSRLGSLAEPLHAVGELLAAKGAQISLVVVGGAAIILRGVRSRATADIDVIAITGDSASTRIDDPNPLPDALSRATELVARAYGLPPDWINAVVGHQWLAWPERHAPRS